jgi:uncharacterized protein YkwD
MSPSHPSLVLLPPPPERVKRARRPNRRTYFAISGLLALVLITIVLLGPAEAANSIFQVQLGWFLDATKTGQVIQKLTLDFPLHPPRPEDQPRFERLVAKLLNQARAEHKLAPIAFDGTIENAAREYSTVMSRRGFFGSVDQSGMTPGARLKDAGYDQAETVLEAIGSGYQTPDQFVAALLANGKTAAIVLKGDVDAIGVGYAFNRQDRRGPYYHYWTVDLVKRAGSRLPLHGPPDVFRAPKHRLQAPRLLANGLASNAGPDYYQTSQFMADQVAVGIVFPQCNGALDRCSETWTPALMDRVYTKIQAAMSWWTARMGGNVTFVFDQERAIPTGYEPIKHPQHDESLWIGEVLKNMGFPAAAGQNYFDQVYAYNNWLRQTKRTDWAFTLFVANSVNSATGTFADGYFAYAYGMGPFAVETYDNASYGISEMPAVVAHETGHIFGALDEYAGANVPCTDQSGYLIVPNQNSQLQGCLINLDSIMRGGVTPYQDNAVDPYALGQMGFRDLDHNGRPDVLDTQPLIVLDPGPTDAVSSVTVTGTAQDQPNVPASPFPEPGPPPITINYITGVQYSIDGIGWQNAAASDGAFDSVTEAFSFSPALTNGTHTIEVQATNRVNNLSSIVTTTVTIAGAAFTPTPMPTGTAAPTATGSPMPTTTPTPMNTATPVPTVMLQVSVGWNLIAVPGGSSYTAASLASEINSQGGTVSEIDRWNLGNWQAYLVGYPFNNYKVDPLRGLFVRASAPSQWQIKLGGTTDKRTFGAGWNLLAAPACRDGQLSCYTASSLVASINARAGSAVEVDDWANGSWVAYMVGYPFNDFAIQVGRAYFVNVKAPSTWTPDQ